VIYSALRSREIALKIKFARVEFIIHMLLPELFQLTLEARGKKAAPVGKL
jgi:hypothetical protein